MNQLEHLDWVEIALDLGPLALMVALIGCVIVAVLLTWTYGLGYREGTADGDRRGYLRGCCETHKMAVRDEDWLPDFTPPVKPAGWSRWPKPTRPGGGLS